MKRTLRPFGLALAVSVLAGCSQQAVFSPQGSQNLDRILAQSNGHAATVEIKVADQKLVTAIELTGAEILSVRKGSVDAAVTAKQASDLKAKGFALVPVQIGGSNYLDNTFDPAYHTYDELLVKLKAITAANPQVAKLVDIGDSWEKTQGKADRDIWAVRLGKPGATPVLFTGCTHARELATVELPLMLIEHLVQGNGRDPKITQWLATRDIWIVPMLNPDGHARAAQGLDWRKNANHTYGGAPMFGVDLNRNYSYQWAGVGTSRDPKSPIFVGGAPFSEPETQAIKKLHEQFKFPVSLSYHSYSEMVLYPWAYTNEPAPDQKRMQAIADKLAEAGKYDAHQSSQLYPHAGEHNDYAYHAHGTFGFTYEVGSRRDGFDPPYSRVADFWNQTRPGAELLIAIADAPKTKALTY
jgi:carboxypeptidase T